VGWTIFAASSCVDQHAMCQAVFLTTEGTLEPRCRNLCVNLLSDNRVLCCYPRTCDGHIHWPAISMALCTQCRLAASPYSTALDVHPPQAH
jgi:hypothetical protein